MLIYKNYFVSRLPGYIIQQDSYKDVNGKGFVVRFIEIFGEELDEYQSSALEGLEDQLSVLKCDPKFLDYYAVMLGDITRISDDDYDYRRFLSYLLSIYKVKGTLASYEGMMGALGYEVELTEEEIAGTNYDDPDTNYDEEIFYDVSCPTCSGYELNLIGTAPMNGATYKKVLELIALIEPINAILKKLLYNGDEITNTLIEIEIDENGDLIYNNDNDPDLILTLVNGDLIISGPEADQYYMLDGDLYYIY